MAKLLFAALYAGATPACARSIDPWDYWGLKRPAVTYRIDLSKNDAVCKAVVQALNNPRPGDNRQLYAFGTERPEYAPSLYRDPLFLRWTLHEVSEPLGVFPNENTNRYSVEWAAVSLYNDGTDVAVVRFNEPVADGQRFIVFDDLDYFERTHWSTRNDIHRDKKGFDPLPLSFRGPGSNIGAGEPDFKNKKRWRYNFYSFPKELSLASFANKTNVVARIPNFEQVVVFEFTPDRQRIPLCLISSSKPVPD